MRASTVVPGDSGSAKVTDLPDAAAAENELLVDVGVLPEPTSVVAKAWVQIELIGTPSWFAPERVLLTGAGPIGLLALLQGCLEVHVLHQEPAALQAGRRIQLAAGVLNPELVLDNDVVFGSVNANLRHHTTASEALARGDLGWLGGLITRRVPLDDYADAHRPAGGDVKVVLSLGS